MPFNGQRPCPAGPGDSPNRVRKKERVVRKKRGGRLLFSHLRDQNFSSSVFVSVVFCITAGAEIMWTATYCSV